MSNRSKAEVDAFECYRPTFDKLDLLCAADPEVKNAVDCFRDPKITTNNRHKLASCYEWESDVLECIHAMIEYHDGSKDTPASSVAVDTALTKAGSETTSIQDFTDRADSDPKVDDRKPPVISIRDINTLYKKVDGRLSQASRPTDGIFEKRGFQRYRKYIRRTGGTPILIEPVPETLDYIRPALIDGLSDVTPQEATRLREVKAKLHEFNVDFLGIKASAEDIVGLDVEHGYCRTENNCRMSRQNVANVAVIVNLIDCMFQKIQGLQAKDITVLTPYNWQRDGISEALRRLAWDKTLDGRKVGSIEVCTVTRFGKRRSPIVIFDPVTAAARDQKSTGQAGHDEVIIPAQTRMRIGMFSIFDLQMLVIREKMMEEDGGDLGPVSTFIDLYHRNYSHVKVNPYDGPGPKCVDFPQDITVCPRCKQFGHRPVECYWRYKEERFEFATHGLPDSKRLSSAQLQEY